MKSKKKMFPAYKRQSISSKLDNYCVFSTGHNEDFIEVTEWINGEGFDVLVSGRNESRFSITFGQFSLLKKMVKQLEE